MCFIIYTNFISNFFLNKWKTRLNFPIQQIYFKLWLDSHWAVFMNVWKDESLYDWLDVRQTVSFVWADGCLFIGATFYEFIVFNGLQ